MSLFGTPSAPPSPTPAPTSMDAATKAKMDQAAEQARLLARNRKGAASTLLTGGMGDISKPVVSRPSLLGFQGGSLGQSGAKTQLGL